jgi:hypothetical protein
VTFGAQLATGAYCIAIAHLISHPRDAQGAIATATAWLQNGLAAQQQVSAAGHAAAAAMALLQQSQALQRAATTLLASYMQLNHAWHAELLCDASYHAFRNPGACFHGCTWHTRRLRLQAAPTAAQTAPPAAPAAAPYVSTTTCLQLLLLAQQAAGSARWWLRVLLLPGRPCWAGWVRRSRRALGLRCTTLRDTLSGASCMPSGVHATHAIHDVWPHPKGCEKGC